MPDTNSGSPGVASATPQVKPCCRLAPAEACRLAAAGANPKESTTHVEACPDTSRDAGSIPAASTPRPLASIGASGFFYSVYVSFVEFTVRHFSCEIARVSDFPRRLFLISF